MKGNNTATFQDGWKGVWIVSCLLWSLWNVPLIAQDTLYMQDFSGTPDFFLNSPDLGSTLNGTNKWVVNNEYDGGNGTFTCLGFPLNFTVPPTPVQPTGIQGSPNSEYLHILNDAAEQSGVLNANYLVADGLCVIAETNFAAQSANLNTTGYDEVELSFWWMCGGSATAAGELYFSIDGGITWIIVSNQFVGQSTWTRDTFSLPVFANQTQLRFGFRFVNGVSTTGSDPSFSIDDILITATQAIELQADSLSDTLLCSEGSELLTLHFSASGGFASGNEFIAEISDELGDFNNPFPIGTITAQGDSSILCQLPAALPVGSGHRIRVRSTDPPLVGRDSLGLVLASVNFIEGIEASPERLCPGDSTQLNAQFLIGNPTWQVSSDGSSYMDLPGGNTNPYTYQSVDSTVFVRLVASNGVCPDFESTEQVLQVAPVQASFGFEIDVNDPLTVIFSDSSSGAVIWDWDFGDGVMSSMPNPIHTFPAAANYDVCLVATSATGCVDTACEVITATVNSVKEGSSLFFQAVYHDEGFSLFTDESVELSIKLWEISGKKVAKTVSRGSLIRWEVPGLSPGVYMLVVQDIWGHKENLKVCVY